MRLRHDLPWIAGLSILAVTVVAAIEIRFGIDSHAYWVAARGELYTTGPDTTDAFLYSPAFAQAIRPLAAHLPWPAFGILWSVAAGVTLALLLRPLGLRRATPFWLCCSWEIVSGNVNWLFAVVAAFGLSRPYLWAIPALTKISPTVGLVWFLVRRDWWKLTLAAGTTLLIVTLSFWADPAAWLDWFEFLRAHGGQSTSQVGGLSLPLVIRAPLGVLIVVWGAKTNRAWTVPAAMMIATPVSGIGGFAILAALPRLARHANNSPANDLGTTSTAQSDPGANDT